MVQQKMVMKLTMEDAKKKAKALKTAVGVHGVVSVTLEADKIVVVGDGVDSVDLTRVLRKKMGHVELLSVAEEKKEEKKDEKKGGDTPVVVTWPSYGPFMQQYPIMIQEDPYNCRQPASCIIL